MQLPPFLHGLELHSLMSEKKKKKRSNYGKKCFYKPQKKKHFVRFQAGFHKRETNKDFIRLHNLALEGKMVLSLLFVVLEQRED